MTQGGMQRIDDKPAVALAARIFLGGRVADAILDESAARPSVFSLEYQRKHTKGLDTLQSQYLQDHRITEPPQTRYQRLAQAIADYRTDLRTSQQNSTTGRGHHHRMDE